MLVSLSHQGSVGVPGVPGKDGQMVSSLDFVNIAIVSLIKATQGSFT